MNGRISPLAESEVDEGVKIICDIILSTLSEAFDFLMNKDDSRQTTQNGLEEGDRVELSFRVMAKKKSLHQVNLDDLMKNFSYFFFSLLWCRHFFPIFHRNYPLLMASIAMSSRSSF